jgi:hypothetical protein
MSAFSSEVDIEDGKYYCRTILEVAIKSPVWRRYLRLEHLNLLGLLASSIGIDYYPSEADLKLIPALAEENLLNGAILKTWLQITWLELHIFFPDSKTTQQAQLAIKELFIRRPELMDDFRAAINLSMQEGYYRNYPDNMTQRARDTLEEICKAHTS